MIKTAIFALLLVGCAYAAEPQPAGGKGWLPVDKCLRASMARHPWELTPKQAWMLQGVWKLSPRTNIIMLPGITAQALARQVIAGGKVVDVKSAFNGAFDLRNIGILFNDTNAASHFAGDVKLTILGVDAKAGMWQGAVSMQDKNGTIQLAHGLIGWVSIDQGSVHLRGNDGTSEVTIDAWLNGDCLHADVTNVRQPSPTVDLGYLQSGWYGKTFEKVEDMLTLIVQWGLNKNNTP